MTENEADGLVEHVATCTRCGNDIYWFPEELFRCACTTVKAVGGDTPEWWNTTWDFLQHVRLHYLAQIEAKAKQQQARHDEWVKWQRALWRQLCLDIDLNAAEKAGKGNLIAYLANCTVYLTPYLELAFAEQVISGEYPMWPHWPTNQIHSPALNHPKLRAYANLMNCLN